jgi:deazaflavin-dependent oxidoreductase (nitroreductase family)
MPAEQINHPSPPGDHAPSRPPFFVSLFNPIARRLLRGGLPMGPNALLTVRGRTSGLDRTTPVAVVSIDGRRWVIATFGDTNWARNLRAAGRATVTINRRAEAVGARELSTTEAARPGPLYAGFTARRRRDVHRSPRRSDPPSGVRAASFD